MSGQSDIKNLCQLLDRVDAAAEEGGQVTLGQVIEAVGARSFGPLLLVAGVIIASPISGIPGVPTSMGLVVLLIAVQLLLRRKNFWLPRWILNRSASAGKTLRALRTLRPVAAFVDKFLKRRLELFTDGPAAYVIAAACGLIAVSMPMMELIPFSVHGAGLALTAFGLAMIAGDGALALVAFIVTVCTYGLAVYHARAFPGHGDSTDVHCRFGSIILLLRRSII